MQNVSYLLASLKKNLFRKDLACPNCGGTSSLIIDRKYIVTTLRRCSNCKLLYRAPTTSKAENERIYQSAYKEGFTTTMPSEKDLQKLLGSHFQGGEKDYRDYIEVLKAFGIQSGARVFDFGCSWGYGSWQLSQAGFSVTAGDISRPRADYASSRLGVHIVDAGKIETGVYDVFFSAHVIEHVPSVNELILLGIRSLRPGGIFVAFTPNACSEYRLVNPKGFHRVWGFVHPQLIDWEFLQNRFFKALVADTCPYSTLKLQEYDWAEKSAIKLNGCELMFAFRNRLEKTDSEA